MPGEQTRTLWYLVDLDKDAAPVRVPGSANIDDLKVAIKTKVGLYCVSTTNMVLWKLTDPEPIDDTLPQRIKSYGDLATFAEKLTVSKQVSTLFPQHPLEDHVHVLVEILPTTLKSAITASRKHPRSLPAEDDDREAKRKQTYEAKVGHEAKRKQDDTTYRIQGITSQLFRNPDRKWIVDGEIRTNDINGCYYYVDPGIQDESKRCLDAILRREFVLLVGARASGKTTRLFWLMRELEAKGYHVIYLSFKRVKRDNVQAFWSRFGLAVRAAPIGVSQKSKLLSSQDDFLSFFHVSAWKRNVVLVIDDFSDLYHASSDIQEECLGAFREIRNNEKLYAIRGFIAAGTCGILHSTPVFNVAAHVRNPYFTIDETRRLFLQFAKDKLITIDDAVIEDIWVKSNGHPGMVGLCSRVISENLPPMLTFPTHVLSYTSWQIFSALHMNDKAYKYDSAFRTMIMASLLSEEATPAVNLLRSRFVGFLDTVSVQDVQQERQADFLTAEGVLLHSAPHCYHVASAFVDELIRKHLIPEKFPNAPSTPPPMASDGRPHVLEVLTQSLKFFDKHLIRQAAAQSYKRSKVNVGGLRAVCVPRESVYETELMRILTNWLGKQEEFEITGHWHLDQDKSKYCKVVISNPFTPTVVLQVMATGDVVLVKAHIERTLYYANIIADEAWVVHFTCEDDYLDHPTWQSDDQLEMEGVNVVHFWHDQGFTTVSMSARWKDYDGNIQKVNNQPVAL